MKQLLLFLSLILFIQIVQATEFDTDQFSIIYEKNLFSQNRSFEEIQSREEELPPISDIEKKISLLGVVIADDFKKAIIKINIPAIGRKSKKNILSVTVGERLGNIWVKEIGKDRLILVQGEKEYTIPLAKSPAKPYIPERIQTRPRKQFPKNVQRKQLKTKIKTPVRKEK